MDARVTPEVEMASRRDTLLGVSGKRVSDVLISSSGEALMVWRFGETAAPPLWHEGTTKAVVDATNAAYTAAKKRRLPVPDPMVVPVVRQIYQSTVVTRR